MYVTVTVEVDGRERYFRVFAAKKRVDARVIARIKREYADRFHVFTGAVQVQQ